MTNVIFGGEFMAILPSDFNINLSSNPVRVVLGMDGTFSVGFSNTSTTDVAYNLTLNVNLPDGVSFVDSSETPTSIIINPDQTISIELLNIKDLAPNEVDFEIQLTLKSDENFRDTGDLVPFDIPLTSIDVSATVDTLPRGDEDPGNQKITKTGTADFIPLRYNLTKSSPGKIPKGAGLITPPVSPQWPFKYTLTVFNNTREPSQVTLVDNLPNGVRYLDNINVTGPDALVLSSPTVIIPSPGPGCQDFVTINWGTVTLSAASTNGITFDAAIWDNFTTNCVENSGSKISHMTPLQNIATLDGLSGPVQAHSTINAMDATIDKSVVSQSTDVGLVKTYTLAYRINQYDDVSFFTITDLISDGQIYNSGSATITPDSITVNPDGTTELFWNLGLQDTGTSEIITFETTVNSAFIGDNPVAADDTLNNNVNIDGRNQTTLTPTSDSSTAIIFIVQPSISKEILGYFYKDGSPKLFDVAAPGDKVSFKITYDATDITASQLNIQIDEFAPSNMGPLPSSTDVIFGGTVLGPFNQQTISPNGLRWMLGTVDGGELWTATFDISVENVDFVGVRNNLSKLLGQNTEGFSYSDRSQVEVKFGQPNIEFRKTVSGPDVNAIKAGETYTYSITISNLQNLEGNVTDAFEMDLSDTIPDKLTYVPASANVTGTGSFNPPSITGQNVKMTIIQLAPGQSLTLTFDVTVDDTIVAGELLTNNAVLEQPYSQPDRSFQFPGAPFIDSTSLKALALIIDKRIDPTFAKIGDTVTYVIQIRVPDGTIAFNVQLTDEFLDSKQDFIVGSATLDGNPVIPSVSGGIVIFPTIPFIDGTAGSVSKTYSFDVRITDAQQTPPFIEEQQDTATVNWDIDSQGTPAVPQTDSENLQVRIPFIEGIKEQKISTQPDTAFTVDTIGYEVGDIIDYRISLINQGEETAFNIQLTDVIDPLLAFVPGSISTTIGSASESAGTITWNIDDPENLSKGVTAVLSFQVNTLSGVAADDSVLNQASFTYNSNNNDFGVSYGPENTNIVRLRSSAVTIDKTASATTGQIGDDITYTLTITIPEGTIAYQPLIDDILPDGQTYQTGTATRQEPPNLPISVTPSISGQVITFPQNPDIDATSGAKQIIYQFVARITSANTNPPYTETQINSGFVRWSIQSGGPLVRSRNDTWTITATTPHIVILKEQRSSATGSSFTTNAISGLPGDSIEYRITITSDGASPAFNVVLEDILDDRISFGSIVSGPTQGSITSITSPPNATLTWEISQLNNGDTAVLIFSTVINSGVGAGSEIFNQATATYDSNDVNPVQFNAQSNSVELDIPFIEFTKNASTSIAAIGDIITYTLTVTIPDGVEAYNIKILDSIPAKQSYMPESWSPGTAIILPGNVLEFVDTASPRIGPYTQSYTFNTIVESGQIEAPYIEVQRNTSNIEWDVTSIGPTKSTGDFTDVEIRVPHITVLKEQKRQGDPNFTTGVLQGVATGDIIQYRITITNDGANTAFNVDTTDSLDIALTFEGLVPPVPPGIVSSSVPLGDPDGTITWRVGSLDIDTSLSLIFEVKVNSGPAPGDSIINTAQSTYDSASVNPIRLGPEESNQVGFNFTLPEIIKTVDKEAVILGSRITYTVEITIPNGNIAYDVQVIDILPENQSFVSGSLTKNGISIIPVSLFPLIFENPQTIDATGEEVTITYEFEADVNIVSSSPEDIQTNSSTITWNKDPQGDPGEPQSDRVEVYVTDNVPDIEKSQKNFTQDPTAVFTTSLINAEVGDIIHYQYVITNTINASSIFNIRLEDNLFDFLNFESIISLPSGGTVIEDNSVIIGNIGNIQENTTAVFVLAFEVLSGAGTQSIIPNEFTIVYDVNDTAPSQEYGPITSNEVEIELPQLEIQKDSSITVAEIGEIFEYSIDVTVPDGTIAYNVVLTDVLPDQQIFIGEATVNGVEVFPTVAGQEITFDPITIDASLGIMTFNFAFKARVVEGNTSSPFTEIQTNNVEVNWEVNQQGTPASPVFTTKDIIVNSPSLSILKEQRILDNGTSFTTNPLAVKVGDILEFRITVNNNGEASAYNIMILDQLNQFEDFIAIGIPSIGSASYNSVSNTVEWNISELKVGSQGTLNFKIKILEGISAGGQDTNDAVATYDTNQNNPITFGPIDSNKVVQLYPNVQITKSTSLKNAAIGDTITYTVEFILPKGTLIFNGQFTDILPIGQEYNNNATLNGNPITASEVMGNFIAFPVIPFAQAGDEDEKFTYTFEAKVVSAKVDPLTLIEIQTNNAEGNWELEPGKPALAVNSTVDLEVTNSTIDILKEQKNVTLGGSFTVQPITASTGDIVEYRLQVTNVGPNDVFSVTIEDILSSELAFLGAVNVPAGTNLTHSEEPSNGVVQWLIPQLKEGSQISATFAVEVLSGTLASIANDSVGKFKIDPQSPSFFGNLPSNITEIIRQGAFFEFVPDDESRVSDTEAIAYSVNNCNGLIGYNLTSLSVGLISYRLNIQSLSFGYDIYIDGNLVDSVMANTPYSNIPPELQNLQQGDMRNIELRFTGPENKIIGSMESFIISISNEVSKEIKTNVVFGDVTSNITYKVISTGLSHSVVYTITTNVIGGIKVFDFILESIFSNVYSFVEATFDGIPITPTVIGNKLEFPTIPVVDASVSDVSLIYTYMVESPESESVSPAFARNVEAIAGFKLSSGIQQQCNKISNLEIPIKSDCILIDKVYSQCHNRVCFNEVQLQIPQGFQIVSVKFMNGEIVPGTLMIRSLINRPNFKRVTFDVNIPITVTVKDSEGNTQILEDSLPIYKIDIVLFMPPTRDEVSFNIILDTFSKLLDINQESNSIAVGVFNVVSSVLPVQLLIPTLDDCFIPPMCEDVNNGDICDDFLTEPGSEIYDSFFPQQFPYKA